ncbi:MAG: GAF domain-containing protein [Anaerolineae bacterium]|nr:GAF domain-containing protein [Anaerolineae bacterium]
MKTLEVPQRGDQAESISIRPDDLLALMFDRMPMGILVLDRAFRIVRYNPTWASYFKHYNPAGLPALRETVGYFDVLPDHRPTLQPIFERVLTGEPVRDPALRLRTGDQTSYWNVVYAPLPQGNKIAGILGVGTDVTDQVLMHEALQQAVDELRKANTLVEQRVEERTRELSTVLRVQQALTSSLNADEVLQLIADEARSLTDAQIATVAMPDGDDLVIAVMSSDEPVNIQIGFRLPIDKSISGTAFITGEPQRSFDIQNDSRIYPKVKPLVDVECMLCVPLKAGNRMLGVLSVAGKVQGQLGRNDEIFLKSIAPAAAMALENARLYERAGDTAVAAERGRLARDLHDSVTQTLFSASLTAEVLPRLWQRNPEEGAKRLEKMRELTRGALAEMRTLLLELRPSALTETSLSDLLHQLARGISSRTEIPIDIQIEGERDLPPEVQIALYRIAQEALNNVAKHSGAARAQVDLAFSDGTVALLVSDDGQGFDPWAKASNHLGLRIMSERAADIGAELKIDTTLGHGTKISAVWTAEES